MVRLSFKQLALRVFGFCPAGSTWHGKFVLRKIEGNRLDVQSHPRLRSWLTGMEDKSNGKEVEASKWIKHGGQFQDNKLYCQMHVQPRFGSQCRP